jgi:WD40 repeat protein
VASGQLAGAFPHPGSRGINGVAFAPGGAMLAAADGNGQVCLWDTASGQLALAFADPGSRGVNAVAFAPGGDLVAAGDGNGCTYLWQLSPHAP